MKIMLTKEMGPFFSCDCFQFVTTFWNFEGIRDRAENWSFQGLWEANLCVPETMVFPQKVGQNFFHYGNPLEWRKIG